VLCIVESYTANSGEIDPENIRARLEILARGESRRWMNPGTLALLERDLDEYRPSSGDNPPVSGDVAARGIPLGLIAAGSPVHNPATMMQRAAILASTTHRSADAAEAVELVAEAIRAVVLQEIALPLLPSHIISAFPASLTSSLLGPIIRRDIDSLDPDAVFAEIGYGNAAAQVVAGAIVAASRAGGFEDAVFLAASQGGAADARAAIAGALAGAAFGTAGIPQALIDGLESRVYVMLAAPWFYQTIQLRHAFAAGDTKAAG
jgi:ADP-ribosylglycohydrolase